MKKIWIIAAIGVLIRIILSATTYHSDMEVFSIAGKLVATGKILNLYDFSSNSAVFNYPPLIYLFHGVFNFLFNIPLLFIKLPYLIFDLLLGFILLKLFDSTKKSVLAFTLWMFNPINLYATYMMGQFDIIPTFFTILSIYFIVKNRLNWAAFSLGFGIAFKIFPLFLVIPLLILGKNYQEKFRLFALSILPYLLSIAPYLSSSSFKSTALFANQSSKSLYSGIPVSGGEAIILFPAFLLFFYLVIWFNKLQINIWKIFLTPLLLFFIFTHFHPQWLLWITPFLILDLVKSGSRNLFPVILIFLSWFGSLFFFDPSLTVGIFAPIINGSDKIPSIWEILSINVDYNFARSIIQTIFVSASFYLIFQFFAFKEINEQ